MEPAMQRRLSRLFLGLFALLQGVAPLLHAHVAPPAGGQTGLHVHAVALAPTGEAGQAISLTLATQPESAAITAPTEHRRDEALGRLVQPGVAHVQPLAAPGSRSVAAPASVPGAHPHASAVRLPPAQGPPAPPHSA
jgi:hypothetical protein